MKQSEWFGCYSSSWNSAPLVPEAYSHPAKVSFGLAERIYKHMIDSGYLKIGDRVLDPFGGIAGFSFHAMMNGLHFYGVELEQRFVDLGQQNIDLWNKRYAEWFANWGTAVLTQGDSRYLTQVIGAGDGCVSSPPYSESLQGNVLTVDDKRLERMEKAGYTNRSSHGFLRGVHSKTNSGDYGQTPGQLGSMPPGDFDAAISSSPYGDAVQAGDGPGARWDEATHPNNPDKVSSAAEYGRTPGQLGNMRMDAAVSSAPYADVPLSDKQRQLSGNDSIEVTISKRKGNVGTGNEPTTYGQTPGQLSNDSGDTFWTAARDIVQQVHEVLKPGGYAAWVCGDFVRKGERVYFGKQWLDLCVAVGFEPVEWITCWKTEYRGTQLDIFGGENHKQVDRVSFFRRLANEKNPEAAILNEDVIIVRKPVVS